MTQSSQPLAGIRVVELATMVSGPFAGQLLADLGAEVLKIEPLSGDPVRLLPPRHEGMSPIFMHFNRNKRSIALDLKSPDGKDLARQLAARADVVLENNRNGAMKRLGLDYASIAAANPRIVYMSVTGFGADGPYADRPAYEHLLQAYSGLMRLQGGAGDPMGISNVLVDKSSALLASNSILAALFARERTGQGSCLLISLMGAVAAFGLPEHLNNQTFLAPGAAKRPPRSTSYPVRTADGHVNGYFQQRQHFEALCRTFGREDLLDDPRFASDVDIFANLSAIWDEMSIVSHRFTTAELVEAAGVHGVPLAPVNTVDEFLEDPQVVHARVFTTIEDAELGDVRQINHPTRWGGEIPPIRNLAPRLGADTDAVLADLGLDESRIAALRERKVVA